MENAALSIHLTRHAILVFVAQRLMQVTFKKSGGDPYNQKGSECPGRSLSLRLQTEERCVVNRTEAEFQFAVSVDGGAGGS
jgi:hypothetical protein